MIFMITCQRQDYFILAMFGPYFIFPIFDFLNLTRYLSTTLSLRIPIRAPNPPRTARR